MRPEPNYTGSMQALYTVTKVVLGSASAYWAVHQLVGQCISLLGSASAYWAVHQLVGQCIGLHSEFSAASFCFRTLNFLPQFFFSSPYLT